MDVERWSSPVRAVNDKTKKANELVMALVDVKVVERPEFEASNT